MINHLEFVPIFALFFEAGFGLLTLQNQANNKKQKKKSKLTTHGKQRSIENIWNVTWSITKNAKIELFWLLMMFILDSSGLHQGTKKAKLRQSQNSCKMPNFFNIRLFSTCRTWLCRARYGSCPLSTVVFWFIPNLRKLFSSQLLVNVMNQEPFDNQLTFRSRAEKKHKTHFFVRNLDLF